MTPPPRILLLADDLTGALDAAAAFAARGRRTFVSLTGTAAPPATEVVALNADTRRRSPAQTRARVAGLIGDAAAPLRFLKIDSTMRGHPGVEISVAAEAAGAGLVLVSPAFPAMGRSVRGGLLLLDGVPLHETEVGADALSPAPSSTIRHLLARHARSPIVELPLAAIRSTDLDAQLRAICQSHGDKAQGGAATIAVCDAESDGDLDRIIAAGRRLETPRAPVLFAGSAGLTGALARTVEPAAAAGVLPPLARPVLVVSASRRSLVGRQIDALVDRGSAERHLVLFGRGPADSAISRFDPAAAAAALALGRTVALRAAGPDDDSRSADGERHLANAIVQGLARQVASLTTATPIGGLIVIGGDTALAVLSAIEAAGIVLAGEPLPGVPLGRIAGGPLDGTPVISKAGAFGDETTLVQLLAALPPEAPAS